MSKIVVKEMMLSRNYFIEDEFDIIHLKKKAGSHYMEMSEPRRIFFFLLKKHTNMPYRKICMQLACTTSPAYINKLVMETEAKLRIKSNIEFIHQIGLIERDIVNFITTWRQTLIKVKK